MEGDRQPKPETRPASLARYTRSGCDVTELSRTAPGRQRLRIRCFEAWRGEPRRDGSRNRPNLIVVRTSHIPRVAGSIWSLIPSGADAFDLHDGKRQRFRQLVSVAGLHQDALFRRSRVAAVPPSPERPTGPRGSSKCPAVLRSWALPSRRRRLEFHVRRMPEMSGFQYGTNSLCRLVAALRLG
jgi:hypothetical protein